ncbi:hypothetical protein MBLNU230_g5158t1 [Neophaeotheca triangularis]
MDQLNTSFEDRTTLQTHSADCEMLAELPFSNCESTPSFSADGVANQASHLHFLNIPAELRLKIYDDLLVLHEWVSMTNPCWRRWREFGNHGDNQVQVLRLNKQVYEEFITVLYGDRSFSFTCPGIVRFFKDFPSVGAFLKSVELHDNSITMSTLFARPLGKLAEVKNLKSLTLLHRDVCKRQNYHYEGGALEFAGRIAHVLGFLIKKIVDGMSQQREQAPERIMEMLQVKGDGLCYVDHFDSEDSDVPDGLDCERCCCTFKAGGAGYDDHVDEVRDGLRAEAVRLYHFYKEAKGLATFEGENWEVAFSNEVNGRWMLREDIEASPYSESELSMLV